MAVSDEPEKRTWITPPGEQLWFLLGGLWGGITLRFLSFGRALAVIGAAWLIGLVLYYCERPLRAYFRERPRCGADSGDGPRCDRRRGHWGKHRAHGEMVGGGHLTTTWSGQ